jgi:stage II sporulation protein D
VIEISDLNSDIVVIGANENPEHISLNSDNFRFVGRGWGHAVGMSQEGAKGMANAGFVYKDILGHYFPGTTIE